VQADLGLSGLLLAESEEVVDIARGRVGDWHVSEASRVALKKLLLLALKIVKLHLGADILLVW